jgi:hypothetical protein
MKRIKSTAALLIVATFTALPGFAADAKKTDKPIPYPLKTCITDDEKLGSMGDPVVFVHEGREIKLCCEGCRPDFKKNPAKYIKKLEKAEKKEKK